MRYKVHGHTTVNVTVEVVTQEIGGSDNTGFPTDAGCALIAVHNQCAEVQKSIEKNYESPKDERLINELSTLYKLLETLLGD